MVLSLFPKEIQTYSIICISNYNISIQRRPPSQNLLYRKQLILNMSTDIPEEHLPVFEMDDILRIPEEKPKPTTVPFEIEDLVCPCDYMEALINKSSSDLQSQFYHNRKELEKDLECIHHFQTEKNDQDIWLTNMKALEKCREEWGFVRLSWDLINNDSDLVNRLKWFNRALCQHHIFVTCSYIDHLLATFGEQKIQYSSSDWKAASLTLEMNQIEMDQGTIAKNCAQDVKELKEMDWRESIKTLYEVGQDEKAGKVTDGVTPNEMGWCPVVEGFIKKGKVAHIVPTGFDDELVGMIFGEPNKGNEIIWDTKNALWIHQKVEDVFNKGRITIVPADMNRNLTDNTDELKLIILDPNLLKNQDLETTKSMTGRN